MTKFVIKLRTSRYSHAGLLALAQSVAAAMNGNLNYVTPNPTLLALGLLITDFSDAITAWGPRENRGSHMQHQVLLDARKALETGLNSLANYCESTTPYNKTAFLSGGWEVKKEAVPVGLVGPVLNFRQFISRVVPSGAVRLKWSPPAEAPKGSISVYRIMNSLTADINTATQMELTRKTTFTDLDAGTRPSNFYWIIPVCTAGNGGIADVVQGYPQGPVVS
jgi:hypothetical protein